MAESIEALFATLPEPDRGSEDAIRSRAAEVLRPHGALARLDEVAAWLAAWQRTTRPRVDRPAVIEFAGDHGVTAEGVSAYPSDVTAEVFRALQHGVATASVMAREVGASIEIVDAGVGHPSGNIVHEAALTTQRFATAFALGRDAVARADADLIVLGEMGIGNTTSAAAVCAALYGGPIDLWTGRGTGVDDATYERKVGAVEAAVRRIGETTDPLEILREVGGSELVAIAGAVFEARLRSVPVLLDGFVVTASVAPLAALRSDALAHCWAGHRSAEPGHHMLLAKLGMEPLLDLGLRLGEGSGALAAVPLVKLAALCVTDVATFDEWGLE